MNHQSLAAQIISHTTADLKAQFTDWAGLSLILLHQNNELALGFIRRAQQQQDRWSGHVAFPGGRPEPTDADDLQTALRETQEETGIILHPSDWIGRLNDVQARAFGGMLPFFLRPHVFYLSEQPSLILNPTEVSHFYWRTLRDLQDQKQATTYQAFPAIAFPDGVPLWGLTYLILNDLLSRLK